MKQRLMTIVTVLSMVSSLGCASGDLTTREKGAIGGTAATDRWLFRRFFDSWWPLLESELSVPCFTGILTLSLVLLSGLVYAEPNFKQASNGVKVDIRRPYYDSDKTVIQDKLHVIEFQGGFGTYEGGKNYARAFGREAFAHAVESALGSMEQVFGLNREQGIKALKESGHQNNLKQLNAGLYEFLRGVSDETKIPIEDLIFALNDGIFFAIGVQQVRDHVLQKLGFIRSGCTVAGFDNGILGQNNDNPVKYSGANILVKSVDDKIMLLTMGSPFVWLMGMSDNLAVVVNTIDAFFQGHAIDQGGLPDGFLIMHALLAFTSVDQVIEHYKDARMDVSLSVTFADKKGGLATIEFSADSPTGNIVIRPKHGQHYIAHTNHPRFSEKYLIETWFNGDKGKANSMFANTFWRQEYAENFLAASASHKEVRVLQHLFRQYPVLFAASDGLDFRTTTSVIWNIKEGCGYISPDRPDITEYERVCF